MARSPPARPVLSSAQPCPRCIWTQEGDCFDLSWAKIRGPFAAHIHVGAAGQFGDIVVHFFNMKDATPIAGTIKGVSGCGETEPAPRGGRPGGGRPRPLSGGGRPGG